MVPVSTPTQVNMCGRAKCMEHVVRHLVSEVLVPTRCQSVGATMGNRAHGSWRCSHYIQTGSEWVPLLLTRDASVKFILKLRWPLDSSFAYRAVLRNRLDTGWRPRAACYAPTLEQDGSIHSRIIVVLQRLHMVGLITGFVTLWESSHSGILQCSAFVDYLLIWTQQVR